MPKFAYSVLALALILFTGGIESASRRLPVTINDSRDIEKPNARADVKEVLNYRLPNTTYPEHYAIELTTNVHAGERPFTGKVVIDIVVVEPTTTIVIHARQLKDFEVTIANPSTGVSEVLSTSYEMEREFLTLTRTNGIPFEVNSKWKLNIKYNGDLRKDNGGFYLSTYTGPDGKERFLATTQFESTDARHAFPCYDEPSKRANFTITINHDASYSAISNMPINKALSSPGKTVFLTSAPIPTYIVAFIVSDFAYSEAILNGLPHRVYSRPSTKGEHEWALVSSMLITERLTQYYDMDFILPKLDQVAIPDFSAGGMENWGLVTYREEYLLYNKTTSTTFSQTNVANIAAHEITHQWFGDLVAIEWWTYLWLKEGFASIFSYKALDQAYPEWGVWQHFQASEYQNALIADGIKSPRPMTHYVQKPREISSLYDSVSYGKAGSVLDMWSHALTDEVFRRGLHNYLTVNQYTAAKEEKLFEAIQIAAKELNYALPATIQEMMSSWTHQGGYPLLTVTRNYNNGSFTIKQTGYHDDKTFIDQKTWYVPINYAVASNPDFRDTKATHFLMNVAELKVKNANVSKNDWLLLNKQSTGYYRINYDEENWKLLSQGLINRPHKIHPRNRAQLMHDAYHFTASDRLSHSILLEMMTYLKQEDQYAPWATAEKIINTYNSYLNGDKDYKHFQDYISDLVAPTYEKLGVNDESGEQHYQKYTRNSVVNIACLAGIKDCLEESNNKLKDLVEKNIPIEPNLQSQIYCNGLKQSSDEVFNFVYNKLMESTDQAQRRSLIFSLGCSQQETQLKRFIGSSIDKSNKLRDQERYTLLRPAYSRGEVGLLTCIDFLNKNWQAYGNLKGGFGGSNPLDDDIRGMAAYVVNKKQEEQLLALVANVKGSEHVTDNLEDAVKNRIKINFNWLERNRAPLMTWINNYHNDNENGNGGDGAASLTVSAVVVVSSLFMAVSRLF